MLSDRALLIGELLEKSSEIALKYYNSPGTELKEDQSVVTLADKAIEEYLVSRLEDLENDVYVIGEETSESKSLSYIEQALKKKRGSLTRLMGQVCILRGSRFGEFPLVMRKMG